MSNDLYHEIVNAVEAEHKHMVTKTLTENPTLSKKIASLSALTMMIRQEMEKAMKIRGVQSETNHQTHRQSHEIMV